jgi:hypothetical protein
LQKTALKAIRKTATVDWARKNLGTTWLI